jgi:DNA mismatch endonuclease (patch repair protein)
MDRITTQQRSRIMCNVRSKNTKPEKVVRSALHRLGFRFRLHRTDLPGKPDIVLPKHHKIIFVHGCFWHSHEGCSASARPSTNKAFWDRKLNGNIIRNKKQISELELTGWKVLIIWECQTTDRKLLDSLLCEFLKLTKETYLN